MRLSKHTRVFGLLFLFLALVMLFQSWITAGKIKSSYYGVIDSEEALEEMEEYFDDLEWYLDLWCGIDVDFHYDEYADIYKDTQDGISAKEFEALSRWELSVTIDMIGGIFSAVKEYGFDGDLFDIGDFFESIADLCEESDAMRDCMTLYMLIPVYFIAFWTFVICCVIALYKRFKGYSSGSEWITFVAAIVMTVIMLVYVITMRSLYEVLFDDDISVKIRLTLIPFLTVALAMPSSLLDRLPLSRINLSFIPDDALDNLSDKSSTKFREIKDSIILPNESSPSTNDVKPVEPLPTPVGRAVHSTEYKYCRVCGAQIYATNEYCTKCGEKQSSLSKTETPPAPVTSIPTPTPTPTPTPAPSTPSIPKPTQSKTDGWFSQGSDL